MNKKIVFIISTISLLLVACPASHFHAYKPIINYKKTNGFYEVDVENDMELLIRVGYLRQFINEKEHVLLANITANDTCLVQSYQFEVFSKNIGKLSLQYNNKRQKVFTARMPNNNENQNLKLLNNDTLNIRILKNNLLIKHIKFIK